MDKKIRIAGIIAAIAFSIIILTSPSEPPPIPSPTTQTTNEFVEILATNLEKPWAIEFYDNKIFLTEKAGKIKVIESGVLLDEPLATLRTVDIFGGGLLGIALHPDYENNHFLYVYYTYEEEGKLWNKVLRIKESMNKIVDGETIFDKIPGSKFNNGGVIKFGPDLKLYVATGISSESSHAPQDLESLEGKILRINPDGSIPEDNPFTNSPVFSYGHRNPQGMAWDNSGNLFITELGPSKNDEINLIKMGQNYGWPEEECSGVKKFEDALTCFDPSIEPGGLVFYSGDKLPVKDKMIMATLRGSNLYKLDLSDDGKLSQKSILSGIGRIRDVNEGPDGFLYIITSNTDGKGFPDSFDDKLLRILK